MSDPTLDAAARALARRLLAGLPADRPRTRADVDRLPSPVARLLHAHLDAQADEATSVPTSAYVDPEADGVRAATQTWREAVREAVRVPADVWAPAVEDAAHLAVAHLVRPAGTLAAYAFDGTPGSLPAADALRRTQAFGPYGYLPEIAGRYVERKEIGQIDRYGLELLLRRIDRRMVSAFGPDEWAELLTPLVDLVGPDGQPEGAVPADLLRAFFLEKDVRPSRVLLDEDAASESRLRDWLEAAFGNDAPHPEADDVPTETPAETLAVSPAAPVPPPKAEVPAAQADATASVPEGPVEDGEASEAERLPPDVPEAVDTEVVDPEADDDDLLAHFGVAPGSPASGRAPEAPPPEAGDDERPAPPVIGSRYNDPADEPVVDSDVLGPARAVPRSSESADEDDPSPLDVPIIFPHSAPPDEDTPELTDRAPDPDSTPDHDASPTDVVQPADDATEAEPLWARLARERGGDAPAPTPEADPLWKQFAGPDEAEAPRPPTVPAPAVTPPAPLGDLEPRVLGFSDDDERRAWFVADLFGGSTGDYHRTLVALDACHGYTEATKVIEREVFQKHRVNPYTEAAVAFVDALQAQFTR